MPLTPRAFGDSRYLFVSHLEEEVHVGVAVERLDVEDVADVERVRGHGGGKPMEEHRCLVQSGGARLGHLRGRLAHLRAKGTTLKKPVSIAL